RISCIDVPTGVVRAFDFDAASGAISRERVVVRVPEGMGVPDGMTIDRDGMLWVAHHGAGVVARWDPKDGSLLGRIDLPVSQPTCCAFGGPELDVLYITSARENLDAGALAEQPLAGGLFSCRPGARGYVPAEYAG